MICHWTIACKGMIKLTLHSFSKYLLQGFLDHALLNLNGSIDLHLDFITSLLSVLFLMLSLQSKCPPYENGLKRYSEIVLCVFFWEQLEY